MRGKHIQRPPPQTGQIIDRRQRRRKTSPSKDGNLEARPLSIKENAYKPPQNPEPSKGPRRMTWAIWAGVACLLLAGLGFLATAAVMIVAFRQVAEASAVPPQQLADSVSAALPPAALSVVLGGTAGLSSSATGVGSIQPRDLE